VKPIEKKLDGLWFRAVAKRANGNCEICCTPTEHPAHHIFGRGKSVRWELDNGILLCFNCHTKAHKNDKAFRHDFGTYRIEKLFRSTVKNLDIEAIKAKLEEMIG